MIIVALLGLGAVVAIAEMAQRLAATQADDQEPRSDAPATVGQGISPDVTKRPRVQIPGVPGPAGRYQDPGLPLGPARRPTTVGGALSSVTASSLMSSPHLGGAMYGSKAEGNLAQALPRHAEDPSPMPLINWLGRAAPVGAGGVGSVIPVGYTQAPGIPGKPVTGAFGPTAPPAGAAPRAYDSSRPGPMSSAESAVGLSTAAVVTKVAVAERPTSGASPAGSGFASAVTTTPNPKALIETLPKPPTAGLALAMPPSPAHGASYFPVSPAGPAISAVPTQKTVAASTDLYHPNASAITKAAPTLAQKAAGAIASAVSTAKAPPTKKAGGSLMMKGL